MSRKTVYMTAIMMSNKMSNKTVELSGFHEPQEEKIFYEILKYIEPNSVMFELGSYWAAYSMWFNSEISGSKNYMVETDLSFLEVGRSNFNLNNMSGTFINGTIPRWDILEYMKSENIKKVNLLHTDIQGSELDLIKSIENNLDLFDFIFISTHDDKTIHYPILEILNKKNMNIICEFSMEESFHVDGLIVASNNSHIEKIEVSKR